ncbi:MAG: helix-hairpin-helix domain-containing protein [Myxococcaceae bacterium]|jgi:competence protein ComEA|nr:helix-hairpin-helix domain-containing protein [Myxococcaceae bacterium]
MKTATKVMAVVAVAFLAMSGEALAAKRAKTKLQLTGQLNLNTATQAQLDQLPGVGEKAAKRIIEHRTKTPFTKVEELTKVKGFGKKKLEKLKGNLTVSGPTTLTVRRVANTDAPTGSGPAAALPEAQGRAAPVKR